MSTQKYKIFVFLLKIVQNTVIFYLLGNINFIFRLGSFSMKEVYETVRNLREDNDLKQKDVADFLKMSRTTYNHYELGHSSFTADMIVELAHFFKTTPNVLLSFKSEEEITDTNLLKLCKFVKSENIDVDKLINFVSDARNL